MAHCLMRIIYKLVSDKVAYDESIFARLEVQHAQRQHLRLERQAAALGYDLVPSATPENTSTSR
jgi:hypothetical protein